VKSRFILTRIELIDSRTNLIAISWIMKDDMPSPVIKVDDPILAASFGATLAYKTFDS